MKYSIVSLKNVLADNEIFRYDADYFHPNALKVLSILKSKKHRSIEKAFNVTKLAGFEYTEYFTQENMASVDNYIALTSKNIQNEELNLQEYITIDKLTADNNLKRSKLQKGDVILSYTGEYRRALTLFEDNYQLGPNICLIRNKDSELKPTYLSTFLNSRLGQVVLDKEKTLSAQPTVAMSRIRKIPIPVLSEGFQSVIDKCIKLKYFNIENSKKTYKQVGKLLLKELNLSNWRPEHKLYSIKKYSDVKNVNRFDAEYFQPKYDEIIEKIKSYSGGWDTLENLIKIHDKNTIPEKDVEYNYIELSNISKNGEITGSTVDFGYNLPTRARRFVNTNDVIASSVEGSLDSIALITSEYDKSFCSTGFYVLTSNFYNPETLLCILKLPLGQLQLKKGCSGTILTAISKEELGKIVLPKIKKEIQGKIKENIQKMYKYKYQSKQLLEIAKRGVEIAIEENEDTATKWINEQLSKIGVEL